MKLFAQRKDWYVINLIIEDDMLGGLSAKLCGLKGCRKLFQEENLPLSAFGIGISVSKQSKDADSEVMADKLLQTLKKKNKRLLITIDDVASTREMRIFSHFFQSCLMKDYDVFLIMNGVYDIIEDLQNEKTLTFLQRAPKLSFASLNKTAVAGMYSRIFDFPEETIRKMAAATGGYPYAVQALGYTVWKRHLRDKDIDMDDVLPELDLLLADSVYDKLWTDMSETDRQIAGLIAGDAAAETSVSDVISRAGVSKSMASNYKKRLIKKGILNDVRGRFVFALPGFDRYVREQFS
ncbi:MAG: hypothetical protein K5770_08875 [Lachnospiraceae bacterium]|nr:hypothetical protein [Lachnospiraceae bacterium]